MSSIQALVTTQDKHQEKLRVSSHRNILAFFSFLVITLWKGKKMYWTWQLIIFLLDKNDQNSRPESIEPMVDTKQQKDDKEINIALTDIVRGTGGKYIPPYI